VAAFRAVQPLGVRLGWDGCWKVLERVRVQVQVRE
jgi:hypothetical protein